MSWFVRRMVSRSVVACLAIAGCSSSPSYPPAKCPTATFGVPALNDSSVTWSVNGSPPQTTTGFAGTGCSFEFSWGEIVGPIGVRPETLLQGFFDVHCDGGTEGPFDFIFSELGDYRDWHVGTFTVPAAKFGMDFFGAAAANQCRYATDFKDLVMTVTVETATGSRAPYPQMVTDDFVRAFRLDFDTSTATPTTHGGQACEAPLTVRASLHLQQTAADYVYNPDAPCICE